LVGWLGDWTWVDWVRGGGDERGEMRGMGERSPDRT
jgi:hypothetical protein